MGSVTVLVLHRPAGPSAGPLERLLGDARSALGERHRAGFLAAGAADVSVIAETTDEPFGARLRRLAAGLSTPGLVVLGSGAIALATYRDREVFVRAAAADAPGALANNRYSADIVALAGASLLTALPDLPGDNALPRWLAEVAGVQVRDLRTRWRLGVDLDSPADLLLPGVADATGLAAVGTATNVPRPELCVATDRLAAVRSVMADARAELLVAGRTSVGTLAALERRAACRVRALVEERGLRAASRLAFGRPANGAGGLRPAEGRPARPPRSVLGMLLDRDGPTSIGRHLADLCDAAVIDTRVLLAHRLGPDESTWPPPEDRFASDLLLPDRIGDPWLRDLTESAVGASVPVALGGHTLVGPGLRLLVGRRR